MQYVYSVLYTSHPYFFLYTYPIIFFECISHCLIYLLRTGYDRVLSNLVAITEILKSSPSAQEKLTQLYQQSKWLDITDKPNADELIRLALGRIKLDPNQYGLFVSMLRGITGLDIIANKLSGESD